MPTTIKPPLTHTHVRAAALTAFVTAVIVVAVSVDAGNELAAVRWLGAVVVIGCTQTILIACGMSFYFRHQRQQRKDDLRARRRRRQQEEKRRRLSAVIEQAEQFKRQ